MALMLDKMKKFVEDHPTLVTASDNTINVVTFNVENCFADQWSSKDKRPYETSLVHVCNSHTFVYDTKGFSDHDMVFAKISQVPQSHGYTIVPDLNVIRPDFVCIQELVDCRKSDINNADLCEKRIEKNRETIGKYLNIPDHNHVSDGHSNCIFFDKNKWQPTVAYQLVRNSEDKPLQLPVDDSTNNIDFTGVLKRKSTFWMRFKKQRKHVQKTTIWCHFDVKSDHQTKEKTNEQKVVVVCIHLQALFTTPGETNQHEFRNIMKNVINTLNREQSTQVILAGDFNTDDHSHYVKEFSHEFKRLDDYSPNIPTQHASNMNENDMSHVLVKRIGRKFNTFNSKLDGVYSLIYTPSTSPDLKRSSSS